MISLVIGQAQVKSLVLAMMSRYAWMLASICKAV
jgi:hypothetical protein